MGLELPVGVSAAKARAAINALRDGVPPPPDVAEWLTVGQESISQPLLAAIERTAGGTSEARLLVGVPGAGKSHLLTHLRRVCLARGFLISHCVQDRATRTTLNRPDLVYRELLAHLDAQDLTTGRDALRLVLDRWAAKALPIVARTSPRLGRLYALIEAGVLPDPISRIPHRTGLILITYLLAVERQDASAREEMLNAYRGAPIENRRLIAIATQVGLVYAPFIGWTPGPYDKAYWLGQFATLAHIVRVAGLAGTVLLLDELESLIDLPRRNSRKRAYDALHALLFNDYSAPALLTLGAFTPAFVNGLRRDTDALGPQYHEEWSKVWREQTTELPSPTYVEATELLQKIERLHGLALGWTPDATMPDPDKLIRPWMLTGMSVGDLVRRCVAALDTSAPA